MTLPSHIENRPIRQASGGQTGVFFKTKKKKKGEKKKTRAVKMSLFH